MQTNDKARGSSATLRSLALAAALGALPAGCERSNPSPDQFVPSPALAHEALDATLLAWQNGAAPAAVDGGKRAVQVADTHRTPGQSLASYKILGETAIEGGRRFIVRLQLENPPAAKNARYVVVGIDPLWVFRQEDYDMIAHWDHPMPSEAAPPKVETDSNDD